MEVSAKTLLMSWRTLSFYSESAIHVPVVVLQKMKFTGTAAVLNSCLSNSEQMSEPEV